MFRTNMESTTTIPLNIKKLCQHLADDDPDVTDHLYKLSVKYLSKLSTNKFTQEEQSVSEQFIVSQIRKTLGRNRPLEDVAKFDLIYAKLQKNTIIHNKSAILTFLFHLSMEESCKSLGMLDVSISKSRHVPRIKMSSHNSAGNVKKLRGMSTSQKSLLSTNTQTTIQTIQAPSLMWANSEPDISQIQLQSKDYKFPSSVSFNSFPPTHVTEGDLILDIIYSFQGIEGKYIKKDYTTQSFYIDPRYTLGIGSLQKGLVERLLGLGFLYNNLKQFCDDPDKEMGIIGQSLIAVVRDELTEYFRLVATLQAQLKRQTCADHSELTLRRVIVWIAAPQRKLEWLVHIVEQCQDKKGGALISAVHGFLQHGATSTQTIALRVLSAVCRPLYHMLARWLLDGDLNDNYSEFFIEARSISGSERMWHDKYVVRQNMVPSFISMDQANKILATGKSINFLRHICKDTDQQPGREALQKIFDVTNVEALFAPEQSIDLHLALNNVYKETSLRVIDLLKERFKLMEHLQALRRYLLLGQGDFIRHLLDLLALELNKSAQNLYPHALTAILDSAVRVTNAQFEEEDTLKRLNVCITAASLGDTGWDVFSLVYCVDGPISTIFQSSMKIYKMLFGVLWNAKRMEFVLSNMRKQQITSAKLYRNIKELHPVLHKIHILTSEMIHFLNQMQDYFLSEILECAWVEMFKKVNHAECLDDIITAHATFLDVVHTGFLLKDIPPELCTQLRLIFSVILKLQSIQENLYAVTEEKSDALAKYAKHKKAASSSDENKVDVQEKASLREQVKKYHHFLQSIMHQVKQISSSYKDFMQEYLQLLSASSDINLQLLSVRLNFNDYYKVM